MPRVIIENRIRTKWIMDDGRTYTRTEYHTTVYVNRRPEDAWVPDGREPGNEPPHQDDPPHIDSNGDFRARRGNEGRQQYSGQQHESRRQQIIKCMKQIKHRTLKFLCARSDRAPRKSFLLEKPQLLASNADDSAISNCAAHIDPYKGATILPGPLSPSARNSRDNASHREAVPVQGYGPAHFSYDDLIHRLEEVFRSTQSTYDNFQPGLAMDGHAPSRGTDEDGESQFSGFIPPTFQRSPRAGTQTEATSMHSGVLSANEVNHC